jgi:hypothetical protein
MCVYVVWLLFFRVRNSRFFLLVLSSSVFVFFSFPSVFVFPFVFVPLLLHSFPFVHFNWFRLSLILPLGVLVYSSLRSCCTPPCSFVMDPPTPTTKAETISSSAAAAASSEPIPRSYSTSQHSLRHSTPQPPEPQISLSQMRSLITSMFQEFQTTVLPQQIANAVRSAIRNPPPLQHFLTCPISA